MARFQIEGGYPLHGEVKIDGMKNAAVAMMIAAILIEDVCVLENVPLIMDVVVTIETLRQMGVCIDWEDESTLRIDAKRVISAAAPDELVRKMRASSYLLGAELGRFGKSRIAYPGGCDFGQRPLDQHIKGFAALGADCDLGRNYISVAANGLHGAEVEFDLISVGATMNVMLAAVKANGKTVLHRAACEPHICDVAHFLNACGAKIEGIGTNTLTIYGGMTLHGCRYRILPDMIEAGTFLLATATCGGSVMLHDVIPSHLECVTAELIQAGATIAETENTIKIDSIPNKMHAFSIKTGAYPLFPTDLQPQVGAYLATENGVGEITESVWAHRFQYCEELKKMGAQIMIKDDTARFYGCKLHPAEVKAVDLRAGAAMVIAALATKGVSNVNQIYHIERGYSHFAEKLQALGAKITRFE